MFRLIMVILFMAWIPAGFAQAADVGMLTQVEGCVQIVTAADDHYPAAAFQKVAGGDRLVLGGNARVQVVYFQTSRQEVWIGAGTVEIGDGLGSSSELQAESRNLPPLVARQLVKTPVSGQHGRTGMVTVRSLSSDTVESLQKQYRDFRGEATEGDTTPEVFLLTGLMEMMEYEEAEVVLEELKARLSVNPALADVIMHFEPLVKEGLAGL